MSRFGEHFYSFIQVSIGAVLGSYLRLKITSWFILFFSKKYLGTFFINILATFLLGLIIASSPQSLLNKSQPFFLIICIGFLGGLSTFSTFIMALLASLLNHKWKDFFSYIAFTLIGGILAAFVGYQLGND